MPNTGISSGAQAQALLIQVSADRWTTWHIVHLQRTESPLNPCVAGDTLNQVRVSTPASVGCCDESNMRDL